MLNSHARVTPESVPARGADSNSHLPPHPLGEVPRVFQVLPIDYPDPADLERERSGRAAQQHAQDAADTAAALRLHQAVQAATLNGRDEGCAKAWREAYKTGWAWGVVCGIVVTLVFGGTVVIGFNLLMSLRSA